VEHYEIAACGCARTYARLLGDKQGVRLLNASLREEAATDKKLTKLAKSVINLKACKAPQGGRRWVGQRHRSYCSAARGLMENCRHLMELIVIYAQSGPKDLAPSSFNRRCE